MKVILSVLGTIALITLAWVGASHASESNQAMKACLAKFNYNVNQFDTFDFSKAARCHSNYRQAVQQKQLAEMRDFLKHNARYRVPGQSLNRCWGKPREMPFESAYIKQTPGGFEAGVNYKDKLPAGCYENAPWDNREATQ